ncbi:hypothetical protein T01_3101 [Trichinella spiralis]|uniref:Uncharacterized protein n=1 Tax=Trichinella spiralis TaxID=6334 RepID=A0A0V1BFU3_TRISP|nr:hypothetical protein T01_3101 [Trichinella spiralis]
MAFSSRPSVPLLITNNKKEFVIAIKYLGKLAFPFSRSRCHSNCVSYGFDVCPCHIGQSTEFQCLISESFLSLYRSAFIEMLDSNLRTEFCLRHSPRRSLRHSPRRSLRHSPRRSLRANKNLHITHR